MRQQVPHHPAAPPPPTHPPTTRCPHLHIAGVAAHAEVGAALAPGHAAHAVPWAQVHQLGHLVRVCGGCGECVGVCGCGCRVGRSTGRGWGGKGEAIC
jgi:hypothetical protein